MASPRAYPSARESHVCDRPAIEMNPAFALLSMDASLNSMLMPALNARSHSKFCSARVLQCWATKEAEHAVSNDEQEPCSPSANDTRPQVADCEVAVSAYTLVPAGSLRSTSLNSLGLLRSRLITSALVAVMEHLQRHGTEPIHVP